MTIKTRKIKVANLDIDVVHKDIKNLHVGVYPPNGRIRVAAPLIMSDDAVTLAVIDKLGWIKRQKLKFESQARESKREVVNGESHYFLGQRYRLDVVSNDQAPSVTIKGTRSLEITVPPGTTDQVRLDVLQDWYRKELKTLIGPLAEKWCARLELNGVKWGVRRMRTKWGSCSFEARRVWLNLELAKKPIQCLEYVIVHELVHFVARNHDDQFSKRMDTLLPQWRSIRDALNQSALPDDGWVQKGQNL